MHSKNGKPNKKESSLKMKNNEVQSQKYETMSQGQNRYGNGRQKAGSEGSNGNGGFSNH